MAIDLEALLKSSIGKVDTAEKVFETIKSAAVPTATVDATFRDISFDLCDADDDATHNLQDLLSLVMDCADREICSPDLQLSLFEEAMDTQTIAGCNALFGFLETHRQRMTAKMGKGQILLRLCNELLRRLSKTEDTVFCGRILIFLSLVFPLSERSAVNLRGEYNIDNVTTYEDTTIEEVSMIDDQSSEATKQTTTEATETILRGVSIDQLYTTFWSLQKFFNNPVQLISAPMILMQFRTAITRVIEALEQIEDATIPSNNENGSADLPTTVPPQAAASAAEVRAYFTPKVLTSKNLLALELADLSFRRHILVQTLIVLDFLLGLTLAQKEAWNTTGPVANKSMQIAYILSVADSEWISDLRAKVVRTIGAGTHGKQFLEVVETLLQRDQSWLRWKCDGCPSYDQPSIESTRTEAASKRISALVAPKRPYQHAVGNAVLSKLWTSAGKWSTPESNLCSPLPTPESFLESIKSPDAERESTSEEDEIHELEDRKASKAWRALRVARMSDIRHFTDQVAGGNLENYIKVIQKASSSATPERSSDSEAPQTSGNSNGAKRHAPEHMPEGVDEKRQKLST